MTTRKKYDKQFKLDAVQLIQSSEKSTFEIATDLGINPNTLWRWIKELGQSKEKAYPGNGKSRDEEMRLLQREIADLRLERDILKKAVAIFSQPERRNTNS
jgi:transposase